jgi:hypothetical protein
MTVSKPSMMLQQSFLYESATIMAYSDFDKGHEVTEHFLVVQEELRNTCFGGDYRKPIVCP